jgi:hypothetical protein
MSADYEKPEHKTNLEKAREAENTALPRWNPTYSDRTKMPKSTFKKSKKKPIVRRRR